MAGFSINEVNKLTFKVQAAGVIDASAGARWYESSLAFSPNIKDPDRVLTNYNLIPSANLLANAVTNAAADPTNISDLSAVASAVAFDQVYAFNNSTWVLYNTPGDKTSGFLNNWILPSSIPQSNSNPSNGYQVKLWSGDPAVSGVEIPLTAGQGNTPEYVGWVFNYDQGILFISDFLQGLISAGGASYPGTSGGNYNLYITGFRYVGATGVGGGSDIEILDEGTSITTAVKDIDFVGTGVTVTGSGTGNENIQVSITAGSGLQGTQGITGSQGTQGITGSQGTQGTQGITGSQGTQGTQGITGSQGTQGITGAGTQGTQGITGSQGTQGITGSQGTQGITGSQGTQGTQGITGSQGTQGTQGIAGIDGAANIQAGDGIRIDPITGGIDEINVNIDSASNLYFNTANELSVTGGSGAVEIANSQGDGTSETFLTGDFTKLNFVDGDSNGTVFAMADANDSDQVNVFFPAPPEPSYPPYFNRTGAFISENNFPGNFRVAIPNTVLTGTIGGNYLDGGYSSSNTLRNVYLRSTQNIITYGTGNFSSPVLIRGFSGLAGAGDSTITVTVHDADYVNQGTPGTSLDTFTISNINANGTFTSTSGDIKIIISDYATIINPYNPQHVYQAKVKVEIITGNTKVAAGVAAGIFNNTTVQRDGGKFSVSMVMVADTDTITVNPPAQNLPAYYDFTVFADDNPNTPSFGGTASVEFPTVETSVIRQISGISYYTANTKLSTGVDEIVGLNGNSIKTSNINFSIDDWSSGNLTLSDTSYNLSNGTISLPSGGAKNDWDQIDIDYDTNTTAFTISNTNWRFRANGGDATCTIGDPWNSTSATLVSTTALILIDTGNQSSSTSTIEAFNFETQRLFRDTSSTTAFSLYTSWDNTKSLADATQPPNSRTAISVDNTCFVGGTGITPSDFYADNGNSPQTGTVIAANLSSYLPSGNPNYNGLTDTPIFHRKFFNGVDVVTWEFTASGSFGTSGNFTQALLDNNIKIYVWAAASAANTARATDTNTGNKYTYLPTYNDGNPGSTYPNWQNSYTMALHGGGNGQWSAGGWIGPATPAVFTGLDTPETRMLQTTQSSGNTARFTFGDASNVAQGGFYVEIQLIDTSIRLSQITATKIN